MRIWFLQIKCYAKHCFDAFTICKKKTNTGLCKVETITGSKFKNPWQKLFTNCYKKTTSEEGSDASEEGPLLIKNHWSF